MRSYNYLSLINFLEKLHRQRLSFINEHDVGGSNYKILYIYIVIHRLPVSLHYNSSV